jgi:membrane-bound metal-dependent hydrolase YbcI (DUF457 family)
MNILNHFLTSFSVLYTVFHAKVSLVELILFSLVFGVLIDLDQIIGRYLKKPNSHTRTWIEEPAGLIFIGIPTGLFLSMVKYEYFFMVMIPYAIHILLDYLTIHEVSPFAPFSKKNIEVGFFKSVPTPSWYTGKEKGISEGYFLILNVIIAIILVLIM